MTTDTELRDLLSGAAHGPAAPDWEGVVRRGRHHRRQNRIRTGLAGGVVTVVAALGAVTIADLGRNERTGVVADAPDGSTTTTPAPTTTLSRLGPLGPAIRTDARVSGSFVTILIDASDPTAGFDPCASLRPKVTESATAVVVEIVDSTNVGAEQWAACQASPFSGWATVELTDPLGSRPLFGSTGDAAPEIPVIDNANLLFPTVLPAPFDITHWDEFGGETGLVDRTFSWSADDLHVSVRTAPLEGSDPIPFGSNPGDGCSGEPVTVRGFDGALCRAEGGGFVLLWDEGGYRRQIELGPVSDNASPFTLDDLFAIADGLGPLG
jgi:hypothetical protein